MQRVFLVTQHPVVSLSGVTVVAVTVAQHQESFISAVGDFNTGMSCYQHLRALRITDVDKHVFQRSGLTTGTPGINQPAPLLQFMKAAGRQRVHVQIVLGLAAQLVALRRCARHQVPGQCCHQQCRSQHR